MHRKEVFAVTGLGAILLGAFGFYVLQNRIGFGLDIPTSPEWRTEQTATASGVADLPDANTGVRLPSSPAPSNAGDDRNVQLRRQGPTLEALLFSGGTLRAETAEKVLGADFNSALRRMRSDSMGDQDAQELTRLYSQAIASTLKTSSPQSRVEDIACGVSICGVDVRGGDGTPGLLENVLEAGGSGGPRIYSAVTHVVRLGDGSFSYRMFFSTDPGVRQIVVPPPKPDPEEGNG